MSNLRDLFPTPSENITGVCAEIGYLAVIHSKMAQKMTPKGSFQPNTADITTAQSLSLANDSHLRHEKVKSLAFENKSLCEASMDVITAKAENTFANAKSIVTTDGRRRGYEIGSQENIIKVNFKPNKYDMAS